MFKPRWVRFPLGFSSAWSSSLAFTGNTAWLLQEVLLWEWIIGRGNFLVLLVVIKVCAHLMIALLFHDR